MPFAPKTLRPRSVQLRPVERDYEDRRRRLAPWRKWYGTARWRRIRAAQLAAEPCCRMCAAADPPRVTPATVCDHVEPHRGDEARFFGGPFQSLCGTCHNSDKHAAELAADRAGAAPDAPTG